jgi:hypothetical protein
MGKGLGLQLPRMHRLKSQDPKAVEELCAPISPTHTPSPRQPPPPPPQQQTAMRKAVTARTQPTSDVDATQMKGHMTNLWIRCRYQRGSWCLHSTCPPRDKHDPPARCSFCMMPAGWCLCRCRPHRGRRTGRYLWRTGRSQARMGCTPHQLPPARSPLHTGCTRLARPPCTPVSNPLLCTCPSPVRTHRS